MTVMVVSVNVSDNGGEGHGGALEMNGDGKALETYA